MADRAIAIPPGQTASDAKKLDFGRRRNLTIMPHMDQPQSNEPVAAKRIALLCGLSVTLLWLSQPPLGWWPFVGVALVPWIRLIRDSRSLTRRGYAVAWAVSAVYFFVSLQGLRHAHPLMIFPAVALAGYLAVYHVLFLCLLRRLMKRSRAMVLVAPALWVGLECIRNYLLTGLSALMLAHALADVSIAIQIADLFGSYGISFVVVAINVGFEAIAQWKAVPSSRRVNLASITTAGLLIIATLGYGTYRLQQPLGNSLASFALIQRSEPIEYVQSDERAIEIFQAYIAESQRAIQGSSDTIDTVVWPESMFTAGLPWMILEPDARVPDQANLSPEEFAEFVRQRQAAFADRVAYTQSVIHRDGTPLAPELMVGCGVVRYGQDFDVYSGLIHIGSSGRVRDWYGKTHLVMFGEYVPIAPWIPGVRDLIPPGMGLTVGPGPKPMTSHGTSVLPVICIETAVERVTVNQLAECKNNDEPVDVIVTISNDGWFDNSSVVEHHLRCGQLVAVATRRPLLSAANNGPTAWIDSNGVVVERLPTGSAGSIVASPQQDDRESLYVRLGAIPAWICAVLSLALAWRAPRTAATKTSDEASSNA